MGLSLKSPLWWLLAAALIIKLGYIFFALPDASSPGALSVDALYHYNWAAAIASGEILVNAPYFRAPLYPFFLALILKLSGFSLIAVRVAQILIGCGILALAYRMTEKMAGRPAATIAALLLLLYPIMTYYEGELLLDLMFTALALLSLYFLSTRRRGKLRPVSAGLCFGLATIARPTILVFLPFALGYYLLRNKTSAAGKAAYRSAAAFAVMVIITIAPVTIVNYVTSGQLILVSYQGGVNFYIGNNPAADGLSSILPPYGHDWTLDDAAYAAQMESGRHLKFDKISSFWYRKGISYALANPLAFTTLYLKKLYFVFAGHEISDNRPLDEVVFGSQYLRLLPIRMSLITALAVLPLFLVNRRKTPCLYLYGLVLVYGMTVALFFVNARFRLPVIPLLAVLGGIGATAAFEMLRRRRAGGRLVAGLAAAVLVFIATSVNPFGRTLENPQQALFLRGNAAFRQGDYALAAARFDSLTRTTPYYEKSYLNLGLACLKLGESRSAEEAFRRELASGTPSPDAANNLGVLFLLRGQYDSALGYSGRALTLKPYHRQAAVNYLRAALHLTDPSRGDEIERQRMTVREYFRKDPQYLFEEALYLAGRGQLPAAIDNQRQVFDLSRRLQPSTSFEFSYSLSSPEGGRDMTALAAYQLGYLYGLTGHYDTSVVYSQEAIRRDPQLKEAYLNLISGYTSLRDAHRADSVRALVRSRWPGEKTIEY